MKHKFFHLAKLVSKKSPSEVKVGCVIVKGNYEISVGFNDMRKTHPKSPHPFRTRHAEFDAMLGVDPDLLNGATAYVYRELKDGRLGLAKPCRFCEQALKSAGINVCYFTCDNGYGRMIL